MPGGLEQTNDSRLTELSSSPPSFKLLVFARNPRWRVLETTLEEPRFVRICLFLQALTMAPRGNRSTSGRDSWRTSPRALFREVAAGFFRPWGKVSRIFIQPPAWNTIFPRFLTRKVSPRGINSVGTVWQVNEFREDSSPIVSSYSSVS